MSLREYIQNSADAIDDLPGKFVNASINITVDGRKRSLIINDNGTGIPSDKAKSTLLNIGCSEKDPDRNRGFRGIGRLGGLGYCDELRFVTKSRGEDIVSHCVWDCRKLRQLIADRSYLTDTASLIKDTTTFKQQKYYGSADEHFFAVEMNDMHGDRNELLNVPAIRSYVAQVAPVPFHPDFSHGAIIDRELLDRVKSYKSYRIFVNDERIYKPYRNIVGLSKENSESVTKVNYLELRGESGILGFGWIGDLSLQGTVSTLSDMEGLRLRYGNILIGNKETLSGYFKEKRFNNYLIGEIHICSNVMIPNSRRDDFEDCKEKDEFYSAFLREIGIPLSRKIRYLSGERSKANVSSNQERLFENAYTIVKYGYVSKLQREHIIKNLSALNGNCSSAVKQQAAKLICQLMNSEHVLSVLNNQDFLKDDALALLNRILEIVYSETSNKSEADRIIGGLYEIISQQIGDTMPSEV